MSDPSPSSALPPEMIEQSAAAIFVARRGVSWEEAIPLVQEQCRRDAIAVLTEALPAIRAQALREAIAACDKRSVEYKRQEDEYSWNGRWRAAADAQVLRQEAEDCLQAISALSAPAPQHREAQP